MKKLVVKIFTVVANILMVTVVMFVTLVVAMGIYLLAMKYPIIQLNVFLAGVICFIQVCFGPLYYRTRSIWITISIALGLVCVPIGIAFFAFVKFIAVKKDGSPSILAPVFFINK